MWLVTLVGKSSCCDLKSQLWMDLITRQTLDQSNRLLGSDWLGKSRTCYNKCQPLPPIPGWTNCPTPFLPCWQKMAPNLRLVSWLGSRITLLNCFAYLRLEFLTSLIICSIAIYSKCLTLRTTLERFVRGFTPSFSSYCPVIFMIRSPQTCFIHLKEWGLTHESSCWNKF